MADKENGKKEVAVRRDVFGLADMRDEMDRLWQAVTGGARQLPSLGRFQQPPAVDVFEKDGAVHVRAEVPGLTAKDIDIEASADGLIISGEKKEETEVKEEKYYRSERTYGKFVRRIPLPRGADAAKAEARFKDGVLEIDMPLDGESAPKKIAVQS